MRRKLIGLTLGLVAAMVIIMTVESLATRLYNRGLPTDASATVALAQQPAGLLLMIVGGWFLAGLIGGGTSVFVSRTRSMVWAVAAAILVGIVVRFLAAPHPAWMLIAGSLAPILGAAIAQTLVRPSGKGRDARRSDDPPR